MSVPHQCFPMKRNLADVLKSLWLEKGLNASFQIEKGKIHTKSYSVTSHLIIYKVPTIHIGKSNLKLKIDYIFRLNFSSLIHILFGKFRMPKGSNVSGIRKASVGKSKLSWKNPIMKKGVPFVHHLGPIMTRSVANKLL